MLRRLFYLFPEKPQVQAVMDELKKKGIGYERMHTLAKDGVDLDGLPLATARQSSDFGAKLESWFWGVNLLIFFIALGLILFAAFSSSWYLALLGLFVATANVWLGNYFVSKVPRVHLDQFRGALSHGEILLMVDVPHWRVREIDQVVTRHHPEAYPGGVGWTIEALHI
jgi:hypothetical protein